MAAAVQHAKDFLRDPDAQVVGTPKEMTIAEASAALRQSLSTGLLAPSPDDKGFLMSLAYTGTGPLLTGPVGGQGGGSNSAGMGAPEAQHTAVVFALIDGKETFGSF